MPIRLREGSAWHRLYLTVGWLLVVVPIVYVPLATTLGLTLGSVDKGFRIDQINTVIAYAVAIPFMED